MNTFNRNKEPVTVLQAITTYNGATLEHNEEQRFYLMFGAQESPQCDVKFQKVCSFSLLEPDSIKLESYNNQGHLWSQSLKDLKYFIQLVSHRLIEMLCSDDGIQIWGRDIPTPTELVESYLTKKTFIFSTLSEDFGCVSFAEIKDWRKQVKQFTAH